MRVLELPEPPPYIPPAPKPERVYEEYHSERAGETVFFIQGRKFQYCNIKRPDGVIDIAVYSFAEDLCYNYLTFRKANNF